MSFNDLIISVCKSLEKKDQEGKTALEIFKEKLKLVSSGDDCGGILKEIHRKNLVGEASKILAAWNEKHRKCLNPGLFSDIDLIPDDQIVLYPDPGNPKRIFCFELEFIEGLLKQSEKEGTIPINPWTREKFSEAFLSRMRALPKYPKTKEFEEIIKEAYEGKVEKPEKLKKKLELERKKTKLDNLLKSIDPYLSFYTWLEDPKLLPPSIDMDDLEIAKTEIIDYFYSHKNVTFKDDTLENIPLIYFPVAYADQEAEEPGDISKYGDYIKGYYELEDELITKMLEEDTNVESIVEIIEDLIQDYNKERSDPVWNQTIILSAAKYAWLNWETDKSMDTVLLEIFEKRRDFFTYDFPQYNLD